MKIPKEIRKLFDKMNKRYKVFKKHGVQSNLWDMVQNELLNVYMDYSERTGKSIDRLNFKQNLFSLQVSARSFPASTAIPLQSTFPYFATIPIMGRASVIAIPSYP